MTADFASLLALLMVEQLIRVEASAQPIKALFILERKKYFDVFINSSTIKNRYKAHWQTTRTDNRLFKQNRLRTVLQAHEDS